jgi:hypothetical protein
MGTATYAEPISETMRSVGHRPETVVDGFINVRVELRQPLRGCYPRDIFRHICWKAKYEEKRPLLTLDAIREACDSYFLSPDSDGESYGVPPPAGNG